MNKQTILIVDDETFYIDVLVGLLSDEYRILVAKDGEQALKRAQSSPSPDLILLDVLMPGVDGYEVCRQLKVSPDTAQIPVIFLTVKCEVEDEMRGIELGAVDYISKPMSPPIVKARVHNHIILERARRELENQNIILEHRVKERTREISRIQDVAIYCLASLAETRDKETGNHIRRTQNYVRALANKVKDHPRFRTYLNDTVINMLYKFAPLHDIGKVGVRDSVLLKPGKLNSEEWEEMKRHTEYGFEALLKAEQELGGTQFLDLARELVHTHHERWDGSGYPDGLAANDIPISGRLMALSDVYDALICRRVYKEPIPHEEAVQIIISGSGSHFDPDLVAAFREISEEFFSISQQYADEEGQDEPGVIGGYTPEQERDSRSG